MDPKVSAERKPWSESAGAFPSRARDNTGIAAEQKSTATTIVANRSGGTVAAGGSWSTRTAGRRLDIGQPRYGIRPRIRLSEFPLLVACTGRAAGVADFRLTRLRGVIKLELPRACAPHAISDAQPVGAVREEDILGALAQLAQGGAVAAKELGEPRERLDAFPLVAPRGILGFSVRRGSFEVG